MEAPAPWGHNPNGERQRTLKDCITDTHAAWSVTHPIIGPVRCGLWPVHERLLENNYFIFRILFYCDADGSVGVYTEDLRVMCP